MQNSSFSFPRSGARWLCGLAAALILSPAFAIDQMFPAAGTCEWPSSIQLRMQPSETHTAGFDSDGWYACSGVYVGNRMVLTAAHCVDEMDTVRIYFGEDIDNPAYTLLSANCTVHPDGEWYFEDGVLEDGWIYRGKDIAYCELPASAPTPPYAPVMVPTGCEVDYLRDELFGLGASPFGLEVMDVASGAETGDPNPPTGTKREGEVNLLWEEHSSVHQGMAVRMLQANLGQEITVRPGDSGGPVLVEMPNDTWRVIAVNSYLTRYLKDLDGNGEEMYFSVVGTSVPRHISWIESSSGRDITPCHSRVGGEWVWDGDPTCGIEFDTSPDTALFDWPGCQSSVLGYVGPCAGWIPPGPGGFAPNPPEADSIVRFVLEGPGAQPTNPGFGGALVQEQIFGTLGDDHVFAGTQGGKELFGGRGNDRVEGGALADSLHGGPGADHVIGRRGNDILIPGMGKDVSLGGDGDDVLVIQGVCELERGEILDGGDGVDKLLSPVPLTKLKAMGVRVRNVEHVILNHPEVNRAICYPGIAMGPLPEKPNGR